MNAYLFGIISSTVFTCRNRRDPFSTAFVVLVDWMTLRAAFEIIGCAKAFGV